MRTLIGTIVCLGALACGATPTESIVTPSELPLAEEPLRAGVNALRVGRIQLEGPVVKLPSNVRRNEPVDAYVTTYGGGCISSDTTVANVAALRATIVPYQREYRPLPNGACTMELRVERRAVRLVFATAGIAVIRVVGRVSPDDSLVAIERRLTVQ
jgi:hypothetical protein